MGEPLPDDPVVLRALLSEAARFLEGVSAPLAQLRKFRRAYLRVIGNPKEAKRQEEYLEHASVEAERAWDGARLHLPLLRDYLTPEETEAVLAAVQFMLRRNATKKALEKAIGFPDVAFDRAMPPREEDNPLVILETAVRRLYSEIGAKLKAAERADAESPRCPVQLGEREDWPIIRGVRVAPLTVPRYRVLQAVVSVWPNGLTKDQLVTVTGQGDAVNTFKAIRTLSPEWESVLVLPGQVGRGSGYRIARE